MSANFPAAAFPHPIRPDEPQAAVRRRALSIILSGAICAVTLLLCTTSRAADLSPDLEKIRTQLLAYTINPTQDEDDTAPEKPKAAARVDRLLSTLTPEGSWPDIQYKAPDRGAWPPYNHLTNIESLLVFARHPQTPPPQSAAALAAAHRALDYWSKNNFKPGGWYNQIGVPKTIGSIIILLQNDISPAERKYFIAALAHSKVGESTGQNRIWHAGIDIDRAILTNDESLAQRSAIIIADELNTTTKDGLQPDWSYHQHGPEQQFGNYGRWFALDMSKWALVLHNTRFAFPPGKLELLRNFMLKGENWVVWRGVMDINACGRQLWPNSPKGKADQIASVMKLMPTLDPDHAADYQAFLARNASADATNDLTGANYFYRSDYFIARSSDLCVSLRMHSTRVRGGESLGIENISGNHLSDGATLLYRSADEYTNIFPVWNWRMIPGTTSILDNSSLDWPASHNPDIKNSPVITPTQFVGGASDGQHAVIAMDFQRDTLNARKAWLFANGLTLCLGNSIASPANADVVTTINQCLLHGPITLLQSTKSTTLSQPIHDGKYEDVTSIEHDGIRYLFPDPATIHLTACPSVGSWTRVDKDTGTSNAEVTANLFTLWLDHAPRPHDASYAYCFLPAADRADNRVKILSNTKDLQAAQIDNDTVGAIFWTPGTLTALGHTLQVDHPCAALLTFSSNAPKLTVADPSQSLHTLEATLDKNPLPITLPSGPNAGASIAAP